MSSLIEDEGFVHAKNSLFLTDAHLETHFLCFWFTCYRHITTSGIGKQDPREIYSRFIE